MEAAVVGICLSTRIQRETKMTRLIHAQNKNMTIVASDSWNTNPKDNHMVQKIIVNPNHPLIIGSAGCNEKQYPNGSSIKILDIMKTCCKSYDGKNMEECLSQLKQATLSFLDDIKVSLGEDEFVQYFIVYYDKNEIKSLAVEFIKSNFTNYKPVAYNKTNIFNMKYASFGVNYHDENFDLILSPKKSVNDLKEAVFSDIQRYIDDDSIKPVDKRRVGGPIQWASISKDGTLSHGVDSPKSHYPVIEKMLIL